MRYDIIKNGRVIGHINMGDMDIELLKALHVRGYKIELVLV